MPVHKRQRKLTALDLAITLFIVGGLTYVGYRITAGLHYKWNWGAIPQYMFRIDPQTGNWVPNLLIQGLLTTIRLSVWATLMATVLGTIVGFLRISRSLFKRLLGRTFVELIRNTPPLVLIFVFYFFVSDQIMPIIGVDDFVRSASKETQAVLAFLFAPPQFFTAFVSATLTVAIFEAAYIAEIVRAGIQSIHVGQTEASWALGMSWWQTMRHVVLPQALQRILPPLAGQFISTIKDSAIVSIISIQELTFQGMELMAATYLTFEIWITVMLLYFGMCAIFSLGAAKLEKRLARAGG